MGLDADDDGAWSRALLGDGSAFAELFRKHRDRVYRRALSIVGDVHAAEDVTSVVFFELWRKKRVVRVVDGSVLPWLLLTTLNLSRNHRRGQHRYRRLIASLPRSEVPDAEAEAIANIERTLLGHQISDALSQVSRTDAALLMMTALDGVSVSDAAEVLGITAGAARVRLSRARHRLQRRLLDAGARTRTIAEGELP